jgi:hypothetical protein
MLSVKWMSVEWMSVVCKVPEGRIGPAPRHSAPGEIFQQVPQIPENKVNSVEKSNSGEQILAESTLTEIKGKYKALHSASPC